MDEVFINSIPDMPSSQGCASFVDMLAEQAPITIKLFFGHRPGRDDILEQSNWWISVYHYMNALWRLYDDSRRGCYDHVQAKHIDDLFTRGAHIHLRLILRKLKQRHPHLNASIENETLIIK